MGGTMAPLSFDQFNHDPRSRRIGGILTSSGRNSRCKSLQWALAIGVSLLVAGSLSLFAACGSKSTGTSSPTPLSTAMPATGTLQIWGGGDLGEARPGTPQKKWYDAAVAQFKVEHPGWNVQLTLLGTDMGQLIAKVAGATTAHALPDLFEFFSGSYVWAFKKVIMPLNAYVDATPGFKDSLSNWPLCSLDMNPNGTLLAAPWTYISYMFYYNKAMFAKAGIAQPPKTFDQLYADCEKLKKTGVIPLTYGDRDGYTTSNWLNVNLGSYLSSGDMLRLYKGEMKFTDPKVVDALTAIVKLHQLHDVIPDATTHEQDDSINLFMSGKVAACEIYPAFIPELEKVLGKNLGVAPLPQSGHGPLTGQAVGQVSDNWWIPKEAKNAAAAWEFIKLACGYPMSKLETVTFGNPPCNKQAATVIQDPGVSFEAAYAANCAVANLDCVIPIQAALVLYKHCQLAFAGMETPYQAMAAVETAAEQVRAGTSGQ